MELPFEEANGAFKIIPSGDWVLLTTKFGVQLAFDGSHFVKLTAPDNLHDLLDGLCADMDGDKTNDMVTRDGVPTLSAAEVGNSWEVPSEDEEGK